MTTCQNIVLGDDPDSNNPGCRRLAMPSQVYLFVCISVYPLDLLPIVNVLDV